MRKKIVILSGAGMSAESGLATFRDAGGLWEGHDVMEVASIEGWYRNMDLVLDFYNQRRRDLLKASPNPGHQAIVRLEETFEVTIVTQNVDDLHERAGSTEVIHLHGELRKARGSGAHSKILDWDHDINRGDLCELGTQLRPHIVWFGEAVPMMEPAAMAVAQADIVIIVGTSMQVYPAAGLIQFAPRDAEVYYLDPRPQISHELSLRREVRIIERSAGAGLPELVDALLRQESK